MRRVRVSLNNVRIPSLVFLSGGAYSCFVAFDKATAESYIPSGASSS